MFRSPAPAFIFPLFFCAATAWADEGPAIIAVFDVEVSGTKLDRATRAGLNDYLFNKMASVPGFKVVPRNQVEKRLRAEKSKSYQACYDQSCQIEIGKELAAQKTLSAKILRFGKECTISLVVYDLRTAATESAADATGACSASQLARSIEAAVVKLRAPGAPAAAAAAVQAGAMAQIGVVDEKLCPIAGTRRMGQPYPDGTSVSCIDGSAKIQGVQTTWHANGQVALKAEYRDGQLEGTYTVFHRNGAIYERGTNKAGKRAGTWTRFLDDGVKDEEGGYENGARAGLWTRWDRDGKKRSETQYAADMRSGKFVEYYPDGKEKEVGQYLEDKKTGLWVEYRSNGAKEEETNYRADKRHGELIEYDSEGRKTQLQTYADGKRNGPWERWSRREDRMWLERKGTYRDGEEDGIVTHYYEDGEERERYTYAGGKKNGPYIGWNKNRDRRIKYEEGQYKDDKKEGRWTRFGEDGLPSLEETWVAGKRQGPATSWGIAIDGGKRFKTAEGDYDNDKQHGRWRRYRPDGSIEREEMYDHGRRAN